MQKDITFMPAFSYLRMPTLRELKESKEHIKEFGYKIVKYRFNNQKDKPLDKPYPCPERLGSHIFFVEKKYLDPKVKHVFSSALEPFSYLTHKPPCLSLAVIEHMNL